MLFNEPKLLKSRERTTYTVSFNRFSALQRAEIAEIAQMTDAQLERAGFSALQRAEIAEIRRARCGARGADRSFSALQRAEIAEIDQRAVAEQTRNAVTVLFNEPKLLKCCFASAAPQCGHVSVLFNEPKLLKSRSVGLDE